MADVRSEVRGGLGILTLARPRALNALDTGMALAAREVLDAWRDDPRVQAVWLQGEGERAFCAGGDVRAIAERIRAGDDGEAFALRYFAAEYTLDFTLHTWPKPLIVWGHGFVLGGGLGMFLGGSTRIVTGSSALAMPEIRIGLFPDVGASWFLGRLGATGAFLALTAGRLDAADALALGLADVHVPDSRRDALLEALVDADLGAPGAIEARVAAHAAPVGPSALDARRGRLEALVVDDDRATVYAVAAAVDDPDPWIAEGARTLRDGSPLSARIVLEQLRRARRMTLAGVFRQDLDLAVQCARRPDFVEGVTAVLAEKRAPRWSHADAASVTDEEVLACFEPPCTPHPLAGLVGAGRHEVDA